VVRLKGGDPFLFGRGGEEVEALLEAGIPYEIVPGVPSATAVPAYQGIPVTHRDYCSSVHIITGHKKGEEPLEIDFDTLKRMGGTMVFLMGVSALSDICRGLLAAGMRSDTPAALLSQGTTAAQKRLVATLGTLSEEVERHPLMTPAIIVVGEVCSLAEKFQWQEALPLSGEKVFITAPKGRGSELAERLRELGAQAVEIPTVRLEVTEEKERLREVFAELKSFQWIAFTSPSAVDIFFGQMAEERVDIRSFSGIRFAVVGQGTKKKLEERGIYADVVPEVSSGEALGRKLCGCLVKGERILIPRAKKGHPGLMREIKKRQDIDVYEISLYDTVLEQGNAVDLYRELAVVNRATAVFTSPLTVRGFVEMSGEEARRKVQAVCIGETTGREARAQGMETFVADSASQEGLLNKILEIARERKIGERKEPEEA
jgi:uroporphyrinogen III methyltransferase/synthase